MFNLFNRKRQNNKIEFKPAKDFSVLFMTDLHGNISNTLWQELKEKTEETPPDLIITMGDINSNDWTHIKKLFPNMKIAGVLGNHDCLDDLEKQNIQNLEKEPLVFEGITFAGMGKSLRYKEDRSKPMMTDKESITVAKQISRCDVFVTHDGPKRKTGDRAHSGLEGIGMYIKNNHPKYHFYGHLHEYGLPPENISGTTSRELFRFAQYKFSEGRADPVYSLYRQ